VANNRTRVLAESRFMGGTALVLVCQLGATEHAFGPFSLAMEDSHNAAWHVNTSFQMIQRGQRVKFLVKILRRSGWLVHAHRWLPVSALAHALALATGRLWSVFTGKILVENVMGRGVVIPVPASVVHILRLLEDLDIGSCAVCVESDAHR
jgi:hypothetical protein